VNKILHLIDSIVEVCGKVGSWLIVILLLEITYDVIMRNVFNSPTQWSYDINTIPPFAFTVIDITYARLHKQYVSLDFLSRELPSKLRILERRII
jgi:TRAP-type mannitol/chloroaromatic compound transport system permease small subunit